MKRATRVLALLTAAVLAGSGIALTRAPDPAAASPTDATIYLLSSTGAGNGTITTMHSNGPGSVVGTPLGLGVPAGETPVALDVRPANRAPYILTAKLGAGPGSRTSRFTALMSPAVGSRR